MRVNTRDISSTRVTPSFIVPLVYNNNNCTCPRGKPASSTVRCSSWSVTHHIKTPINTCIKTWFIYHCHWWQLPQVPFLSRQKFWHHKHMIITTKHMFVTTEVWEKIFLSQQNTWLSWQIFVTAITCLSQRMFCCSKDMFVTRKFLLRQSNFVVTKIILVAAPTNDVYMLYLH